MRWGAIIVATSLAGCYGEPTSAPACSITCEQGCPDGMTCTHGYCVGAEDSCPPTFRATSAGTGFACALDSQDLLWCWGANDHHQLAAAELDIVPRATQIGTRRWDSISTGGGHICGLRDGHLACWGRNDHGQVSDLVAGDVTEPLEIAAPNQAAWSYVVAGYNDTCAIAAGALYCWGAGDTGQLGNGSTNDIGTPTAVLTDLTDWVAVDTGSGRYYYSITGMREPWAHTCAISQSAGLFCWGRNYYGELGDGTRTDSNVPVAVTLPSPPTSVAVAEWTTCATTESQQVYCWGEGSYDALGDPAIVTPALAGNTQTSTPILASDQSGFTKLDANEWLTCGLRDGEVWCWGWTAAGGLGNGKFAGQGWGKVTEGARDLSVGWNANVDDSGYDSYDLDLACILVDGAVQCWGDNRYGQLGQGGATMNPTPREVAGEHHFSALAAGASHMCGIEEGKLLCWGSTMYGQANGIVAGNDAVPCGSAPGLACNVPAPTPLSFAPIADEVSLGANHSCARSGTQVTCWGDNTYSQLGSPTATSPAVIAGAYDRLLDIGTYGQCAKQASQTWCWGGVLDAPAAAQHIAALDTMSTLGVAGLNDGMTYYSFGCGLDATGQLACFGASELGQYGTGSYTGTDCGNGACDSAENATTCPADCTSPLAKLGRSYTALSVGWPTLYMVTSMSYGYNLTPFACGVRSDGQVECWGYSYRGATGPSYVAYTPWLVEGLSGCTAVSTGDLHACALCGGDIYCWGDHRFGAVGEGPITTVVITTPRKLAIAIDEPWLQLVSGLGFTCARSQSGRAFCWGYSRDGALGSGGASSPLPVNVLVAP